MLKNGTVIPVITLHNTDKKYIMINLKIHFDILTYQSRLLSWFETCGRHDLPWQGDFNPYYVWLSEIMLQQTQVKTVIPYFLKFTQRFENIDGLANAEQDAVMHHWAGLGYYARARNLHKTAQIIVNDYDGNIPDTIASLLSLPGIGKSTAHAILSIAFNQATPILDGNVKRVFSRLFLIKKHPNDSATEKQLWRFAQEMMPHRNTQAYTQAQMDLGASICTRTKPKCDICPLSIFCLAYQQNQVAYYPIKKTIPTKPVKTAIYHLYCYQNQLLLLKNPNHGIWGGLYVLPDKHLGFGEHSEMLCQAQKHQFTHFELIYDIKKYTLKTLPINSPQGTWIDKKTLDNYALPAPLKRQLQIFTQA